MNDIDLGGENWNPIGEFTGVFDGNSKVIRNLTLTNTSASNQGLFSAIGTNGFVFNLGIEGASVTGGDNTGILAGQNAGTIEHCYVNGSVSGLNNVGGIVGDNTYNISNSYSRGLVSAKDYYGGLAGKNSGTIQNCYSASEVKASVLNNYLQFSGDDYIVIPHNPKYSTNAFTIEAWFQWTPTVEDSVDFIIGKGYENFEIHTDVYGKDANGNNIYGLRFIPI
jgi:hypothetical protein